MNGYNVEQRKDKSASTVGGVNPVSSVERAITDLGVQLSEVELVVERFRDKLRPILSADDAEACLGSPYPPVSCEVEERIQQLTGRAAALMRQLSNLTGRICV